MGMQLINNVAPTSFKSTEYHAYLTAAYGFFNEKLFEPTFGVKLPDVILTLSHRANSKGYYWDQIFSDVKENKALSEISITFNSLKYSSKEITSTIVHEMCHAYDFAMGTASKAPYHGKSWAITMIACGLMPYNINDKSKITGNKMSHTTVPGSLFDKLADEFITLYGEFSLAQGSPSVVITKEVKKRPFFQCSNCESKLSVPKNLIDNIDIKCKACNSLMAVVQL